MAPPSKGARENVNLWYLRVCFDPRMGRSFHSLPLGKLTSMTPAKLALEDGTVFTGASFGADGEVTGEVVFNTAMTGYQEILTDPSYRGQIVTMTYPEIGNYGVNSIDIEHDVPSLAGFIVREESRIYSNYRAEGALGSYLKKHNIPGLYGIDTRALVRAHSGERGDAWHPFHDRSGRSKPH